MKNRHLTYLCILLLPAIAFADIVERDPFSPFIRKPPSVVEMEARQGNVDIPQLAKRPLSYYRVTGIIVSPGNSIALIKDYDKAEYFASIGDIIGSEGGVIDVISSEGITVNIDGKLVNLTVSNRFDIQNESK